MEQQPAPGRPPTAWAAPRGSAGTDRADDPTVEQPVPFREAPTAETPPPFAPPPVHPGPFRADGPAVTSRPASPGLPPPPLPPPLDFETEARAPTLPPTPPSYDPSPFGAAGSPLPPLPAYTRPPSKPPSTRQLVLLASICSALIAALVTGVLFLAFDGDDAPQAAAPSARLEGSSGLDIQALLARAQPSVVTIHTEDVTSVREDQGAGTGVIISSDGELLTNAHVVARAQRVRVTLDSGAQHEATVVGVFPDADVALLRIEGASDLTPAQLGSSAEARVGDEVVAIGNALNLGASPSVTHGIISALDRTIQGGDVILRGLIQTDAAINPGNSGGPLLNARGEVIGINTAIAADAQNIGFAIPIDDVKPLIEELRQGRGEITPNTAYLGVLSRSVDELTVEQRDQLGITASRGAVIVEVAPDSPAARAGLEVGDVVTQLDGQAIDDADELVETIRDHEPGDEVDIRYERNGRQREATVTLDRRGG